MIAFTIIIAILFLVGLKSQDYRPFDKDMQEEIADITDLVMQRV